MDIPWQEHRDADLQSSVEFWLALVNRLDTACSLVGSMLQLAVTSRMLGMSAHLFAGRSPVTIYGREATASCVCATASRTRVESFRAVGWSVIIFFAMNNLRMPHSQDSKGTCSP